MLLRFFGFFRNSLETFGTAVQVFYTNWVQVQATAQFLIFGII